jgi:hypothetical protein
MTVEISFLTKVETALADFLAGLNDEMSIWQMSSNGWTGDLLNRHAQAKDKMESASGRLLGWLKVGGMNDIVAPAGQTPIQWVPPPEESESEVTEWTG